MPDPTPTQPKRPTLDELLAQCEPVAELPPVDADWFRIEPVGQELI